MRLLRYEDDGRLTITSFDDDAIPPYAILSHTWGKDAEEVTFADLAQSGGNHKRSYKKIRFCGEQAQQDGLQYFWADTCCIDKSDKVELSLAIQSMFRWYQNATKCYVYLSDVSTKKRKADSISTEFTWEPAFRSSRWFRRGWTLQELVAPSTVEFFSQEWERLGDKISLTLLISKITGIPHQVLRGTLAQFDIEERLHWKGDRKTKLKEDMAYSLSGICDVNIAPVYGEGEEEAFRRLHHEIRKLKDCLHDLRSSNPRDDKKRIEDTKGGLLAGSYLWVLDNTIFKQWRQDHNSRLLWVKGDPGKGKTMLLCGLVNELQGSMPRTELLSYFFCQATDSRINGATGVIRGLLYMLVNQQPSLMLHIRRKYDHAGKALFEDANAWVVLSEIFTSMMQDKGLKTTYLVVDALDECMVDLPKLLDLIVCTSTLSHRVKWLVSSRNESRIEEKLKSVEAGLRKQVRDELHRKANGTFLWVALVMEELKKPESWDPLAVVEEAPTGLQQLYDRMMEQIQRLSARNVDICQSLLCTTAVAFRPLYLAEMGSLCRSTDRATMVAETVRKIVAMCGSFLTVLDEQVYLVHQSAKDYLSDKMRATALPSQSEIHYSLFVKSLELLSSKLKRDMSNLVEPGFPIDEVQTPDPDPLATVRYSCIYWVDHLCESKPESLASSVGDLQVLDAVDDFLRKTYLYWLEGLSLCKCVEKGVVSMEKLRSLVQEMCDQDRLAQLVEDAWRFIMYHKGAIESYPLQTYASALLFSPTSSLIRQLFSHEEPKGISIRPALSDGWSACLQTLEGHSNYVTSVAFSHDSAWLASASHDSTVKVWDASSGACLQTLEGHSNYVTSVAFSYDSAWLASASQDSTVKVWDVSSGACLQTLEGHSDKVTSVAFSHDSMWLASASHDSTVKVWNVSSGACLQTIESHSNWVTSVAFSHDSTRLASASWDRTVKIWDTSNGTCLTLRGHSNWVTSVAFSHDSTRLASASVDNTIKIWDASSGACVQTLEGHSSYVSSVAFSYNSTRLVSASYDETIKVWDTSSSVCLQTLEGHSNWVSSVAFSNNSTRLASASWDRTIKIWDMSSGACPQTLEGHSKWVTELVFSHDSMRLASVSEDRTVKIWDASNGTCLQTLEVGRPLSGFSFNPTDYYLYTQIGTIDIQSLETSIRTDIAEPARSLYVGTGFSSDGIWIQHAGNNMLWVPSEYRPSRSSTNGTMVGVGYWTGKVWICNIDL
ncbi:vegetative incompatibility protein HET-E-1 [Pyrenophora tritici-repentis]|nr:vegetative incompatibility protein HET-E-1 [Pyrenophora tritici-repentis]